MRIYLLLALLLVGFSSCKKEKTLPLGFATYLHLAHTRVYGGIKDKVMSEVEQLDFSKYDALMLGGDLAAESTESLATLAYLDSVFDLAQPTTLWTLGNHDYLHPEWIAQYTQRPLFYAFHKNDITFLVFDAQEDRCNTSGAQLELFNQVIDTLEKSTHLVLLHHKLLWLMDGGTLQNDINQISNGDYGGCFHCVPENNFYTTVYPRLVELQNKGIQVICTAGDIGVKVKEFEHQTAEGIVFLASGVKDGAAGNKALLFQHDRDKKSLSWEFVPLDNL